MNVTIHDFEVVSQPEPNAPQAKGDQPPAASDPQALERALHRSRERLARVRAH